jgi:hypothetical protein
MTTNNVRAFIAIAMVVVFIGLTAVMALFPLLRAGAGRHAQRDGHASGR